MDTNNNFGSVPEYVEDRRRQNLRAAMTCFARRGFCPTTMHDDSVQAQIRVGLICRYIDSKDAVDPFMANEHLQDLRAILGEARRASTLTAAEIRARQLAMLRTLWPLLFSRAAPVAPVEPSTA
jgi:AcrR family transcriptional regulator